ncbi:tyrosine-type recombinase/integrase [Paenibacillus thiaminolyticus]|uniref:site-specific integrase n=1 Tax=Paenibacillus thiaminolyticus TaxID=49283 RepID=UPI0023509F01|nr:tyrosine-type recombinase/integrase [Paenibacillus thiaminolyticus]WCR29744.1 tyrosine-type recombinase/integrase [Paenibacillus thiaminolyticus]
MASFTKRGKTWQYTVSHMVNGKSQPIRKGGFKTKKEAQIAAAVVETDLSKGIVPQLKPIPIADYFEDWLKLYKKNVGKNTYQRYLNTHKTLQEHFPGEPIQNITKRQYQAFLNKYGETRTKDTTRKLNTHIRACVKDAVDEGLIRTDFTRGAVLTGGVPSKKPEEKHLSYFDSRRLLKELYSNLTSLTHYLILLGLTSGLRYAELVGLTKDDFNFKTNELRINKTWGYTKKMHKGFGPTKNEQSKRVIKMDPKTMALFKELFQKLPDNVHGLVFFSPESKYKVLCNTGVNKVLKNMLINMNIDPITAHGLRHTHASVLLYKKVSIYYVSERLGHENIDTTLKYYAHIVKELRVEDEQSTVDIFSTMAV